MLGIDEKLELAKNIHATAEALGCEIKPSVVKLMVNDLVGYSFEDICQALLRVRKECSGKLTLKVIIDRIKTVSIHPEASEAWALALPALDESNTVVWTSEISQAWAVALPVLQAGDKVGARMAFIQTYERLVVAARAENRSPCWLVSQGWDKEKRIQAITTAQNAGLLPSSIANKYLPLPNADNTEVSQNGQNRVERHISALMSQIRLSREQREQVRQKRFAEQRMEHRERLRTLEGQREILEHRSK
ncbi:hypothetical protein [Hafnia alvei]|uniref:hypothetical protein n=1 Tax=Hafnia alvei TaxID=569 RepID=UPI00141304FF|nr:hypothetical protein [Hafnia alvei]QIP56853.1 hypothetical protein HBA19_15085 [Hafnia alvei]